MAAPSAKTGLMATPPTFAIKGAHNSILLEMTGLGRNPASGRLLRGLTPYLDAHAATHIFLLTERRGREAWSLEPGRLVPYQELVHWERGPKGGIYRGVCAPGHQLSRAEVVQAFEYEPLSLIDWAARRMEAAVVSSHRPLHLQTCYIPKPWGGERWYTGIEQRGVSQVRTGTGSTALPYALSMFPVPLVGEGEEPPILLKTLEPLPDPIYGDLYLEVHREKWETYVVLDVDRTAWPDGIGYLRAGLDAEALAAYRERHGDEGPQHMAADLRHAIEHYEEARRRIDGLLDEALRQRGDDPAVPLMPHQHRALLDDVPDALREQEAERRIAVERLIGRVPLREGDVVTLPPGVLHSLQHGVKVIEFQTPTYERLIAMFAQKVLTQPHWDVAAAIDQMQKAPYTPQPPEQLVHEEGLTVERIVDFPGFSVERVSLALNRTLNEATEGANRYQLLIVTGGKGEIILPDSSTFTLEPGSGYILPAAMGEYRVNAIAAQGVTYLRASPRLVEPTEAEDDHVSVDDALERTW